MQAYQISPAATERCCLWNLDAACPIDPSFDEDKGTDGQASSTRLPVPGSPGRAKRFCPYPPSRSRRR